MISNARLATYIPVLLLILITVTVFCRLVSFDFVGLDEDVYVIENNHIKQGLTGEGIIWAFTTTEACFWHPLVWLSYMLEYSLFGEKTFIYHLTNLLLHIANTLLLFAVLNRMTHSAWRSWFVAALFAVHPLHVEPVAWIAQRKDVLSTLFFMLTLLAYIRYVSCRRLGTYLAVMVLFTLGLMSKPMLVMLPFVLLLIDYWPLCRTGLTNFSSPKKVQIKTLVAEKVPLLVLSLCSSAIALFAQKGGGALANLQTFPLGIRLANSLVAYVAYLHKTILPQRLAVFYPHPGDLLPSWQVVGAALLLAVITSFVLMAGKRVPFIPVGWFWYFVTLIPVIGLVQVGSHAMADRYTYVPLIGIFILIAWGVPDLVKCREREEVSSVLQISKPTIFPIAAGLVIATLMVNTWVQVGYWKNGETLFSHALKVTSNNWLAHQNLGAALKEWGRIDEAIAHFRRALEIRPDYPDAQLNLANALAEKGDLNAARKAFEKALRGTTDDADVHYNLGIALIARGKLDEAEEEFRKALKIHPNHAQALMNLGSVLGQKGDNLGAIKYLTRAVEIKPDYARAHFNLAVALSIEGNYKGAWKELCLSEKYGFKSDREFRRFLEARVDKE